MSADELARLIVTSDIWAMESCGEPDDLGFYLTVLRRKGAALPVGVLGG
ncbi:hypothetical protein ACQP1W_10780 [Spirillospora sp. CA-255316]